VLNGPGFTIQHSPRDTNVGAVSVSCVRSEDVPSTQQTASEHLQKGSEIEGNQNDTNIPSFDTSATQYPAPHESICPTSRPRHTSSRLSQTPVADDERTVRAAAQARPTSANLRRTIT
jgi:hypothetical protein